MYISRISKRSVLAPRSLVKSFSANPTRQGDVSTWLDVTRAVCQPCLSSKSTLRIVDHVKGLKMKDGIGTAFLFVRFLHGL
jgi:hypothetical protein